MQRDTRFYTEVQTQKESYVLIEELIKSRVSLNPFLTQVITKIKTWAAHYHKGVIQTSQVSPHKAVAQGQHLTVLEQAPRVKSVEDEDSSAKIAWRWDSPTKLGSWLYLIPRSRTWSGCSRVECFRPLEIERMIFSTRKFVWLRERAVGGVEIFIELSQETSHWADFLNSDNVRCHSDKVRFSRTKFSGGGQSMRVYLYFLERCQNYLPLLYCSFLLVLHQIQSTGFCEIVVSPDQNLYSMFFPLCNVFQRS
jgi:hypothetical protein